MSDSGSRTLVIGTRGSALALWQADFLEAELAKAGYKTTRKIIKTVGDRVQDRSFSQMPGVGFFTAEIQEALLRGDIDIAVHSHKDLPTQSPEGLVVAAVSERADPSDSLIVKPEAIDRRFTLDLKQGARVGTSSVRRRIQLAAYRPDLQIEDLRGNVPTRIEAVRSGHLDATVLASAGLDRLNANLDGLVRIRLLPDRFIPAAAQGVLAFECRRGDQDALEALGKIHHEPTSWAIRAERNMLANLRAGCQAPFGAYCHYDTGLFHFRVLIGDTEAPEQVPWRFSTEAPDPDILVVESWGRYKGRRPKSVFVSRELGEDSLFVRAMKDHSIQWQAESLMTFDPMEFEWPKQNPHWIFFSSRTAVRRFAERMPDGLSEVKYGAIGDGTARTMRNHGMEPDYIAEPRDLDADLSAFAGQVKGQRIVFPGAERGLRTAQKALEGSAEIIDIAVYRNQPKASFEVQRPDIAVMTSPMNARTYLEHYPERKMDKFVAIGSSTESALKEAGARRVTRAHRPAEMSLLEALFSAR